jgi:hypothetical protein
MKTKLLILFACLVRAGSLGAQDPAQAYRERMNYIFQYVDKSKIATGLLSDYGQQMVEPAYFDGVPADSNYTNKLLFISKISIV